MFKILLLTLGVAVAAGWVAGGRLRRLSDLHFKGVPILLGSLVVALLPLFVEIGDRGARVLSGVANLVVIGFLAVNVRTHRGAVRAGIAVMMLGWMLNAIVITANGGMPLSPWAYEQSGQSVTTDPITAGQDGFYKIVLAGKGTWLRELGDVIPIRAIVQVVSIGDLLIVAGIDGVIIAAMRRKPETDALKTGNPAAGEEATGT